MLYDILVYRFILKSLISEISNYQLIRNFKFFKDNDRESDTNVSLDLRLCVLYLYILYIIYYDTNGFGKQ